MTDTLPVHGLSGNPKSDEKPIPAKNRRFISCKTLTPAQVERLHLCVRLSGWNNTDEFIAASAKALIADFEAEYPHLFKNSNQPPLLPGSLRILKALKNGHCTVATIAATLYRNPMKDSAIRACLKQLVSLGVAQKRILTRVEGAGRPTEQFTLLVE